MAAVALVPVGGRALGSRSPGAARAQGGVARGGLREEGGDHGRGDQLALI